MKFWLENLKVRAKWRQDDNVRMDLREIDGKVWTGFVWLRTGTSGGLCEHGNKHLGSIKCREFVD
jgi:hypothetical protein